MLALTLAMDEIQ
jgi:mannose-6-phosphate isomerase-like protein (cupin superfamily)